MMGTSLENSDRFFSQMSLTLVKGQAERMIEFITQNRLDLIGDCAQLLENLTKIKNTVEVPQYFSYRLQ